MSRLMTQGPKAAQRIAARMLEDRETLPISKRGGLEADQALALGITSGVSQARRIASNKKVDAYQVLRFFKRFENRFLEALADGKNWRTSKVIQAWELWGGDPMFAHVSRLVRKNEDLT